MTPITDETIRAAINILGADGIADDQLEKEVRELTADDMAARRLIDWIPEAFGIVLVSHISNAIVLPKTFLAKSTAGKWVTLPLEVEPVFVASLKIAQTIYHEGPRSVFQNVSLRSSLTNTVNNALSSGVSLDGASLSGPAMLGIPADVYPSPRKSFWSRLFGV